MTPGGLIDTLKLGAGPARENNHGLEGWGFEPVDISLISREEKEERIEIEFNHRVNDIFNHG